LTLSLVPRLVEVRVILKFRASSPVLFRYRIPRELFPAACRTVNDFISGIVVEFQKEVSFSTTMV